MTRGFGIFACSARRTARGLSVIVFAALTKAHSTHPHRRPVLKFTIRRSPLENDGDGGFCQGDDVRGCALLHGPRQMQSESRMRPRARASVLASARTPPRRLGRAPLLSKQNQRIRPNCHALSDFLVLGRQIGRSAHVGRFKPGARSFPKEGGSVTGTGRACALMTPRWRHRPRAVERSRGGARGR